MDDIKSVTTALGSYVVKSVHQFEAGVEGYAEAKTTWEKRIMESSFGDRLERVQYANRIARGVYNREFFDWWDSATLVLFAYRIGSLDLLLSIEHDHSDDMYVLYFNKTDF